MVPTNTARCHGSNVSPYWSAPRRALHWAAAAGLAGAVVFTSHGDTAHGMLGWIGLGFLLLWQCGLPSRYAPGPALGIITAMLAVLNASSLLAPTGAVHWGLTLVVAAVASVYGATVVFEALHRVEIAWLRQA